MVRPLKWALGLGFLLWLIPFIISVIIFPLKSSDVQLFDSIMAITTVFFVILFALVYFLRFAPVTAAEGATIGLIWLAISLVIDLLMFSGGPMAMPLATYVKDIGIGYLVYPMVTAGMGYLLEKKRWPRARSGRTFFWRPILPPACRIWRDR